MIIFCLDAIKKRVLIFLILLISLINIAIIHEIFNKDIIKS